MNESGNTPSSGDDDWGGKEETPWQQPPPGQPPPQQPPQDPQQPTYGQQPPQYGQQPPQYGGQQPPQYGGQQPPPYGGPPTHQPGEQLPNYLVHSIIATLLCCLPAGVVGIVFAAQVNGKLAAGDYNGAKKSSDQARLWCIISVVAALVFWVIYAAIALSAGGLLTRTPVRILVGAAAVVLPLATVALLDPNAEGHYPTCPVRGVLGVDCPGCGSLRALHDLVHGDVVGALDHNALMILVLPILALELGRWVASRPAGWWVGHRYTPVAALVVLTGWVLLRNLSMFPMGVLGSGAWA